MLLDVCEKLPPEGKALATTFLKTGEGRRAYSRLMTETAEHIIVSNPREVCQFVQVPEVSDVLSPNFPTGSGTPRLNYLVKNDLPYIWTSGRLCNFKGCDREDLQPPTVNGWFWSGSGVKMAPTNSTPPGWSYQPWSYTGHKTQFEARNVSQPDNAEFDINGSVEACMGLLNDIYSDGVKWHDIACYHTKPFICEDSDQLLEYVQTVSPDLEL